MALVEDTHVPLAQSSGSVPRAALRGAVAIVLLMLGLILPGVATTAVVLLTVAYLVAAGLLAATAIVRPRHRSPLSHRVREDVADLAAGRAAEIWPLAAILIFVVMLGA